MNPIDIMIRVIAERVERMKREANPCQAFWQRQAIRHMAEITAECLEVEIGQAKGLRGEDLEEIKHRHKQLKELNKMIEQMNEQAARRGVQRH
ncbi:TPA: hypothetical protein R8G43_004706 [Citrobacter freundii]|uniref:hypothetical protein n=1 Tax=Citrobacter freundii TaxID=546 RepID=UPI0015EA0A85|nr:hypothetical protein [Citrobacter freundii]MDE8795720.1 hypothetical protein [Citrobacter freundii]QLU14071.1 hypothetical protein HV147_09185 [Citrobacter freundii]HCB1820665.1 hypothetical protein [Citrobacter freundii]HEE9834683.1 hypothetical protein [Citrobacter freundii]HEE9896496.1 hypothetical protein [Citrobacter freundii]